MVGVLCAIDEEHDAEALEPDGGSCEGDCAVLPMSCSAVAASPIRVMRCVMCLPRGE